MREVDMDGQQTEKSISQNAINLRIATLSKYKLFDNFS